MSGTIGSGVAGLFVAVAVSLPMPPAMAAPGDPPYDEQYMRLAEILGGLHHLRPLCGANEPQIWRDKMNALIAAEDPTPDRRRRLIDKFNRSYRSFAEVYRTCTPGAQAIIERYLAEGAKLSEDVLDRYGKR
ncbi:MAG: TIGR02301 family protein [Ancalomicrobiaceae bacterium]|nr:TIGR02301 family protein [Ancalomicrobiaceae bacterium]